MTDSMNERAPAPTPEAASGNEPDNRFEVDDPAAIFAEQLEAQKAAEQAVLDEQRAKANAKKQVELQRQWMVSPDDSRREAGLADFNYGQRLLKRKQILKTKEQQQEKETGRGAWIPALEADEASNEQGYVEMFIERYGDLNLIDLARAQAEAEHAGDKTTVNDLNKWVIKPRLAEQAEVLQAAGAKEVQVEETVDDHGNVREGRATLVHDMTPDDRRKMTVHSQQEWLQERFDARVAVFRKQLDAEVAETGTTPAESEGNELSVGEADATSSDTGSADTDQSGAATLKASPRRKDLTKGSSRKEKDALAAAAAPSGQGRRRHRRVVSEGVVDGKAMEIKTMTPLAKPEDAAPQPPVDGLAGSGAQEQEDADSQGTQPTGSSTGKGVNPPFNASTQPSTPGTGEAPPVNPGPPTVPPEHAGSQAPSTTGEAPATSDNDPSGSAATAAAPQSPVAPAQARDSRDSEGKKTGLARTMTLVELEALRSDEHKEESAALLDAGKKIGENFERAYSESDRKRREKASRIGRVFRGKYGGYERPEITTEAQQPAVSNEEQNKKKKHKFARGLGRLAVRGGKKAGRAIRRARQARTANA